MNYLGLDFGEAKIGLATSEGMLAEPYRIIDNRNWELVIKRICQEEKIGKIVIGISEGKSAEKARQFGEKVAAETCLPVAFQDETLTTHDALVKMKRRKGQEDAIAAAFILQAYLDLNNTDV